jgi:hypothetical protein
MEYHQQLPNLFLQEKIICQNNFEIIKKIIRLYIYINKECNLNDIYNTLGLNGNRKYLSFAVIFNDEYIVKNNKYFYISDKYVPNYNDDCLKIGIVKLDNCHIADHIIYDKIISNTHGYDLYKIVQLHLCEILKHIIKLLSIFTLDNDNIAKILGIENLPILRKDHNRCWSDKTNYFSLFCLTILYHENIISVYDKKLNLINQKPKPKFFKYHINNHSNTLAVQKQINNKDIFISNEIKFICEILKENQVKFRLEYKFVDCKDIYLLPFDIYLVDYNAIIEFDGMHHIYPIYGKNKLLKISKHDEIKNTYCNTFRIPLLRISIDNLTKSTILTFINGLLSQSL